MTRIYETIADLLYGEYRLITDLGMKNLPAEVHTINRGEETSELLNEQLVLVDPHSNLARCKPRKFSIVYALQEFIMLFSEYDGVDLFSHFNKNMANYSDDGKVLHGCYGHRINSNNLIDEVVNKLKVDSGSRQAILDIHQPFDVYTPSKDIPCTLSLILMVRDNKLYMTTNMRSNDALWGTPYDIFMFTSFQQVIANTLGVKLGAYTHNPVSLHIYAHHYDLVNEIFMVGSMEAFSTYWSYTLSDMKEISKELIELIHTNFSFIPKHSINKIFYIEECYRNGKIDICSGLIRQVYDQFPFLKEFTRKWVK